MFSLMLISHAIVQPPDNCDITYIAGILLIFKERYLLAFAGSH